jgi:hypothetical protein
MSLHFQHVKIGDAFGILYQFDNVGESIPRHKHVRATAHATLVMAGRIEFIDYQLLATGPCRIFVEAGEIFEFDWTHEHEIKALEPGTIVFNLFLYGQPAGYDELPPSEKAGVI